MKIHDFYKLAEQVLTDLGLNQFDDARIQPISLRALRFLAQSEILSSRDARGGKLPWGNLQLEQLITARTLQGEGYKLPEIRQKIKGLEVAELISLRKKFLGRLHPRITVQGNQRGCSWPLTPDFILVSITPQVLSPLQVSQIQGILNSKTSKTMKPSPNESRLSPSSPVGLYTTASSGLGSRLPLKVINVRFEISGDLAQVWIKQKFEHDGKSAADVVYLFPMPEAATVNQCDMHVGERSVTAKVKPLAKARLDYNRARARGFRAAKVETVRDNLFELQLGNVQPSDEITITLSYTVSLAGDSSQRTLRVPTCPGIRYIPGRLIDRFGATDLVPDGARLNPSRIASSDPHAAVFYCEGTLLGGTQVVSPTHHIDMTPEPEGEGIVISLNEEASVPDRDFVLNWLPSVEPVALIHHADPDYLLCSIHAPEDIPQARGDRDIFFLLDSSGSMDGHNWNSLIDAFELAVDQLSSTDRISVEHFANYVTPISGGLLLTSGPNKTRMVSALRGHSPSGGTEFTEAFDQTIGQAREARRPVIVVITDGQFGDEARACALAASCGIEVHLIGIDNNVNDGVLQKIARLTRGSCTLRVPRENLQTIVDQLVRNLLSPCIERIDASGDWLSVGQVPPLRSGQSALVPFRKIDHLGDALPTSVTLELFFSDASTRIVTLPVHLTQGHAPALLAAKAEIAALLDTSHEDDAVQIACKFNILCEGTAFVAWDDHEKVAVSEVALEQPSLETPDTHHSSRQYSQVPPDAQLMEFLTCPSPPKPTRQPSAIQSPVAVMENLGNPHLEKFRRHLMSTAVKQGNVGRSPEDYLIKLNEITELQLQWPAGYDMGILDRQAVRGLCRNPSVHVLIGYAAVMAWGGMRFTHYEKSLSGLSREVLQRTLEHLKESQLDRRSDFAIMSRAAQNIDGLGIAFYTKLLFFFRAKSDAYILDQFTAKSACLIFENCQVPLASGDLADPKTSPEAYEWFCASVDEMGRDLGKTGEAIESAMFDVRGGKWRNYLRDQYFKSQIEDEDLDPIERSIVELQQIASLLAEVHADRCAKGWDLPPIRSQVSKSLPVRTYCCCIGGLIWQYAIQQNSVSAQVFMPEGKCEKYEMLRKRHGLEGHDFGDGITGNGAKEGKTRTLSIKMDLPDRNFTPNQQWSQFADECVQSMQRLYRFFR
jgi:Ca-activated chloride channel family protein